MLTYRLIALNHAVQYVGVHEQPAGSNSGPLIDKWLRAAGARPGDPWCMAFARGMFKEAGIDVGGGASVGLFETWARLHGYLVPYARVRPGDVACYDWNSDRWPDHVGIVHHVAVRNSRIVHWDHQIEPVKRGDLIAVEGNTAIGDDSDGGRVMFRARHPQVCKFVRIPGAPT